MFAGKTRAMLTDISRINEHNIQKKSPSFKINYLCFKPDVEKKDGPFIVSRGYGGQNVMRESAIIIPAQSPDIIVDIYEKESRTKNIDAIFLNEIQFLPKDICGIIDYLKHKGVAVSADGLLFDYTHSLFGTMGDVLEHATNIYTFTATCSIDDCIIPATHTQRIIKETGLPAPLGELVVFDSKNSSNNSNKKNENPFGYQPRCFKDFVHPSTVSDSYK